MIVCKVCGNRNNDQEEFCTSCGRYLAWSGEHVDVAPEAEPELVVQDALPEAQRHGFWHRLGARLHLVRDVPSTPPAPAAAATATAAGSALVRPAAALPAGSSPAKPAALAAAPAVERQAGQESEDTELVVPELVGAQRGGTAATGAAETTMPVALVGNGNGDASRALRPRRPGESLPVLPPLPGHEPPASERATVLRRPTEVADKPRPRRTRARPLAGVPELASTPSPGDVFCSRCGQFNAPSRTYCRRCGLELSAHAGTGEELGYEPLTWWQRHLHHDVRVVGAGQRPGKWGKIVSGAGSQGRGLRIISRIGALVIGACLLLTFIGPYSHSIQNWQVNTYHSVYNWVNAKEVGVNAASATATSSAAGHPAFSAVDGASNTWWQSKTVPLPKPPAHAKPSKHLAAVGSAGTAAAGAAVPGSAAAVDTGVEGSASKAKTPKGAKAVPPAKRHPLPPPKPVPPGVGQVLTIQFSPSTSLNRIAWLSGAAGSLSTFDSIGRPRQVLISIPGHRPVIENLRDIQSLQTFKIAARNVSSLQVKILEVYAGATVRAVAIDEIEFFTRSS